MIKFYHGYPQSTVSKHDLIWVDHNKMSCRYLLPVSRILGLGIKTPEVYCLFSNGSPESFLTAP